VFARGVRLLNRFFSLARALGGNAGSKAIPITLSLSGFSDALLGPREMRRRLAAIE